MNSNTKIVQHIDGLRAIAVISVIFFHSNVELLSGGYVGVDIFFVISGYLITGLIVREKESNNFSYINFYKRRISRLIPALSITLFAMLLFGFIYYDNRAFNNLGKEIFFSGIGAANILFGRGIDYFANDDSIRPLLHLWSLGVEEQFYIVWPTIILLLYREKFHALVTATILLLAVSFALSVDGTNTAPTQAYFFPQYRAFELLIGALVFFAMRFECVDQTSSQNKTLIAYTGLALMIFPMFLLDENSLFPGINALWPCIGTGLFIAFSGRTQLASFLSNRMLVYIGLISYPLYLYHQPTIAILKFFGTELTPWILAIAVFTITVPLASATFHFVEKPFRAAGRRMDGSYKSTYILLFSILTISIAGFLVAKKDGIPGRFKILNNFAFEVSSINTGTFHQQFRNGALVSESENQEILFIGDSVLQHYVSPLAEALNIPQSNIDVVSRGGCIMLKNAKFRDKFSNTSCESIRSALYSIEKKYRYIVISQHWTSYDDTLLNSSANPTSSGYRLEKWREFINATVDHFDAFADDIILIGEHPSIDGVSLLKPTILSKPESYRANLENLRISNFSELSTSISFFNSWDKKSSVHVIHPRDIFCKKICQLHDNSWSFFSDTIHLTTSSNDFVVLRLKELLKPILSKR